MRKLLSITYAVLVIEVLCIATLSAFGAYSTPQQKPMHGLKVTKTHKGIAGHWLFNEGSGNTVFDLSGNGNNMDFVNSPIWVPGGTGPAIRFDPASNQYLINNTAVLSGAPMTFAAWVKVNELPSVHNDEFTAIAIANTTGAHFFYLRAAVDDKVNFNARAGGGAVAAETSTTITLGKWELWVGVAESSASRKVYLNAGSLGTETTNMTPAGLDNTTVGAIKTNNVVTDYGEMDVGCAMIWNRALSASEISELYWNPFGMFEEDNIALLEAAITPPAPTGGQIIMITSLPVLFFGLYLCRKYKAEVL